eukprot:782056_1
MSVTSVSSWVRVRTGFVARWSPYACRANVRCALIGDIRMSVTSVSSWVRVRTGFVARGALGTAGLRLRVFIAFEDGSSSDSEQRNDFALVSHTEPERRAETQDIVIVVSGCK